MNLQTIATYGFETCYELYVNIANELNILSIFFNLSTIELFDSVKYDTNLRLCFSL